MTGHLKVKAQMARMFPEIFLSQPPSDAGAVSGQAFEKSIYEWLRKSLPSSALVFHSLRVPQIHRPETARINDGADGSVHTEVDFLIANQGWPLIAIEAKSGRMANTQGRLEQIFGNGTGAKDVGMQIARSMRGLTAFLHEQLACAPRFIPAFCCIDGQRNATLGAGLEIPVLLFDRQAGSGPILNRGLLESLVIAAGKHLPPDLTRADLAQYERLFISHCDRQHQRTALQIMGDASAIGVQTSQRIAEILGHGIKTNSRLLVNGCAGSGKTQLLKAAALRAFANDQGRTVLICYNDLLAAELERNLSSTTVEVMTFHHLCERLVVDLGAAKSKDHIPTKAMTKDSAYYNVWLPEAVAALIMDGVPPRWQFDVLLIDEVQDLSADWLDILRILATKKASWMVCIDSAQQWRTPAHPLTLSSPAFIDFEVLNLTVNLRNTIKIAAFAEESKDSPAPTGPGAERKSHQLPWPAGTPVELVMASGKKQMRSELQRLIKDLVTVNGIAEHDVVILSSESFSKIQANGKGAMLKIGDRIDSFRLITADEQVKGIRLDTIRRFKGLESPVIIVVEHGDTNNKLRFLAYTRAQAHLIVIRVPRTPSSKRAA